MEGFLSFYPYNVKMCAFQQEATSFGCSIAVGFYLMIRLAWLGNDGGIEANTPSRCASLHPKTYVSDPSSDRSKVVC